MWRSRPDSPEMQAVQARFWKCLLILGAWTFAAQLAGLSDWAWLAGSVPIQLWYFRGAMKILSPRRKR